MGVILGVGFVEVDCIYQTHLSKGIIVSKLFLCHRYRKLSYVLNHVSCTTPILGFRHKLWRIWPHDDTVFTQKWRAIEKQVDGFSSTLPHRVKYWHLLYRLNSHVGDLRCFETRFMLIFNDVLCLIKIWSVIKLLRLPHQDFPYHVKNIAFDLWGFRTSFIIHTLIFLWGFVYHHTSSLDL